jgi:hypothetical protein
MRYKFIQQHTFEFSVVKMCKVLQVSKSGYYKWISRKPSARPITASYGGLILGGQLGARYYFNPSVAVFGEVGYGIGYLTLGVAKKF